jgi:hypothetical protein
MRTRTHPLRGRKSLTARAGLGLIGPPAVEGIEAELVVATSAARSESCAVATTPSASLTTDVDGPGQTGAAAMQRTLPRRDHARVQTFNTGPRPLYDCRWFDADTFDCKFDRDVVQLVPERKASAVTATKLPLRIEGFEELWQELAREIDLSGVAELSQSADRHGRARQARGASGPCR